MKRIVTTAAAVITAAAILTACGTPALTSGIVIGKQDVPAHNETRWQSDYGNVCGYHYTPHGSYTYSCAYTYLGSSSYQQLVPENWELHVKNGKVVQWVSVSEQTYSTQAIGDHWQQVEGH
jgi:hypothetical protein